MVSYDSAGKNDPMTSRRFAFRVNKVEMKLSS